MWRGSLNLFLSTHLSIPFFSPMKYVSSKSSTRAGARSCCGCLGPNPVSSSRAKLALCPGSQPCRAPPGCPAPGFPGVLPAGAALHEDRAKENAGHKWGREECEQGAHTLCKDADGAMNPCVRQGCAGMGVLAAVTVVTEGTCCSPQRTLGKAAMCSHALSHT